MASWDCVHFFSVKGIIYYQHPKIKGFKMELLKELKEGIVFGFQGFLVLFGISVIVTIPIAAMMIFAMYMDGIL